MNIPEKVNLQGSLRGQTFRLEVTAVVKKLINLPAMQLSMPLVLQG